MIYISVICDRLKSTIDLTWDRKKGRALHVPINVKIPQLS